MNISRSVAPSGTSCAWPVACCNLLSTSPIARGRRTSHPNSHLHGQPCLPRRNPPNGRTASAWCAASRCIAVRTIHVPSSHPLTCFPIGITAPTPICIATMRSRACSTPLDACHPLRACGPHTFVTLFGLYVSTGLRANEPLRLDRGDVDLVNGVLTIRETKFGKSRYVPLHASTQRALQSYDECRNRLCRDPATPSFFVSDRGTRLTEWCVRWTFVKLSHEIGLRGPDDSRGPRLHDLRHRLAIMTLLRWYRRGVDVERQLPQLSTYLGHAHVTDTYWYLTATPELLHFALRRVERSRQGQRP